MKNLLILIDRDGIGGAEVNYRIVIPELAKMGWNTFLLADRNDKLRDFFKTNPEDRCEMLSGLKPYRPLRTRDRFSLLDAGFNIMALLMNARLLRRMAAAHGIDVILSGGIFSHLLLGLSRVGSAKKVVHLQDIVNRSFMHGLYGLAVDFICKQADRIVSISDAVTATVPARFQAKVIKLYNPLPAQMPIRLLNRSRKRVGMFARYTPWKGHEDFIAIAHYFAQRSDIEFCAFGNTLGQEHYYSGLLQRLRMLRLDGFVKLKTFTNDPYVEMAHCDVILHLSKMPEPFGRIIVEANAIGVPVFAYAGGGVDEIFAELKIAGKLFDQGDIPGISRAIEDLHDHYQFPDLSCLNPHVYARALADAFVDPGLATFSKPQRITV